MTDDKRKTKAARIRRAEKQLKNRFKKHGLPVK